MMQEMGEEEQLPVPTRKSLFVITRYLKDLLMPTQESTPMAQSQQLTAERNMETDIAM